MTIPEYTRTVIRSTRAVNGYVYLSPDSLEWHPSEHPGETPASAKREPRPSISKKATDTWPGRP